MTAADLIVNDVQFENCPFCDSERVASVGKIPYSSPAHFSTSEIEFAAVPELWRCENCASSFVQNVVPENVAARLYSTGVSADRWSSDEFQLQKPADQLECMNRYLLRGSSVLDIGCNTGELLDYARGRGCRTSGVEYSESSRRILETKGHGVFASMSEVTGQFDVITAFDLVEHFYDVPGFFRHCKSMLKEGGVLILLTGDIGSLSARICKSKWWYLRYPEHIAFLSKVYFANRTGFLIEEWVRTYASKGYQCRWTEITRQVTNALLRRRYIGLPSIGPDHVLVVLKNDR
jgi:2-polyprenyl-3-methyl-5-hydroxy-6-metoxy-1,4-benzoquinol methylase